MTDREDALGFKGLEHYVQSDERIQLRDALGKTTTSACISAAASQE
jgi:hypothetical protein